MATVNEQIINASGVISRNIRTSAGDRELLAQNILSQARNLLEGILVRQHSGLGSTTFSYDKVASAAASVSADGKLNFLTKFHKLLQISSSHYTADGNASERLMLKYYEYFIRIRELAKNQYNLDILENLEDFPLNLDESLKEYYQKISEQVNINKALSEHPRDRERYYIHSVKPFFIDSKIYYEVTFYEATNKVSKFDRVIGFTHLDITDKYAAYLTVDTASINVLGQTMPITIISDWEVSIRPCEIENFAKLFGQSLRVNSGGIEYGELMKYLTDSKNNLLDIIDMPDDQYAILRTASTQRIRTPRIFAMLDEARRVIRQKKKGYVILRYLLLSMFNQFIKQQYFPQQSTLMSGLYLANGCNPFDTMPYCTSLIGHNPRFRDLAESIDFSGREHELLARRIKNNVEDRGMIYTPESELDAFDAIGDLINRYNRSLWSGHFSTRKIVRDKGHLFIAEYEDGTVKILEKLRQMSASGIAGYTAAVQQWLSQTAPSPDDPVKIEALKMLFSQSQTALIYGAAGTGKSTMVDHIANYFHDKDILFLAHTNPAVDNLKRKVSHSGPFRTIASHLAKGDAVNYDVLVIDECSTVGNSDMLKILNNTSFRLLVLVGDVFQIESIQFGNWFGLARAFIPSTSVFELTTPYRNNNDELLDLWNTVRELKPDITETLVRNTYSTDLDDSLFSPQGSDEIILALNYDGLYGINNINRFLQSSNPNRPVTWGVNTYKVGDPVLFNESERFRPVLYNNLKGKIVAIRRSAELIQFDVLVDRPLTEFDVVGYDLEYVTNSTVRFNVYRRGTGDEDDESNNRTVPFQVAYAVAIHKAQGLEYSSVKVVITNANQDDISHSIFYTAITRARDSLRVYWSAETQEMVLRNLTQNSNNNKDVALLRVRRSSLV